MKGVVSIAAIGLAIAALLVTYTVALGNGAPIRVVLSYLDGVSNTGPKTASGVAEVVMAEGQVSIKVAGLPQLQGESYTAWLVKSGSDIALWAGSFNTKEAGTADVIKILPTEIHDEGYDMLAVTIEPGLGEVSKPGSRVSVAGRFPVKAVKDAAYQVPSELPNTGAPLDGASLLGKLAWAGLLMLAAGIGLRKAPKP